MLMSPLTLRISDDLPCRRRKRIEKFALDWLFVLGRDEMSLCCLGPKRRVHDACRGEFGRANKRTLNFVFLSLLGAKWMRKKALQNVRGWIENS